MFKRIAILGAGSWGLAIAKVLHDNGATVSMWEFNAAECQRLREIRTIPEKLPKFTLPNPVQITNDPHQALQSVDLIVSAIPSQPLRLALRHIKDAIPENVGMVNLAKGIEIKSLKRMSEVIREELGLSSGLVATISGPSHAEEVALEIPTTVVAAGESDEFVQRLQDTFSSSHFRVYTSSDLVGVELGGALKNIIAIGVGITDGLGMGDNTRGALITRGLAELSRLGDAMGAHPETFAGLSGIGDLITTCTSRHSRNRYVGEQIGRGQKLQQVLDSMAMVAEGVATTRSGHDLGESKGVEMPITQEVFEVLFEDKSPSAAVSDLMERKLKAEVWR